MSEHTSDPADTSSSVRPIRRLLVANRGEIARRVFATCRRLGVETVAVHSEADAALPFVAEADISVPLPASSPAETYLRSDLVVEAALRAGADAVHPGYGFLSENADFARAVHDAGLTWVGPAPDSIEAMGSKVGAKQLMQKAGVPVLDDLSPDSATTADLPLLVKASAGGGGRGMRVVRELGALADAVTQASAEASSAFGDGTVFVEPYVEHGRHVEVQVVGDSHGDVLVLGERDCSLQRRHQKVVEEAPAPGLDQATREALHEAARAAAHAIDYVGAGTVEFLLDAADPARFWFLEMNTRLQVEHPVTECVTGLDLVELQLTVAEGGRVPSTPVQVTGHAIEVRLYAEDPAVDYRPQSGLLTRFEVPDADGELQPLRRAGVRLDSGFSTGSEVSTHYDAMLAKVIAWEPTREAAARRLAAALRRAQVHGVRTNRDLLVEVLRHPRFLAGQVSTAFLADEPLAATGTADPVPPDPWRDLACFAAAVALVEHSVAARPVLPGVAAGWRNVTSAPQRLVLAGDGAEHEVAWYGGREGYALHAVDGRPVEGRCSRAEVVGPTTRVVVDHEGRRVRFDVAVSREGGERRADVDWASGHLALRALPRFVDPADQVAEGSLLAPMPGSVIAVHCSVGDEVASGQTVLVMEAMKMQHTITAPSDGVVTDVPTTVGTQVNAGDVLAVVQPRQSDPAPDPTATEQRAGADR
jgi:propionyl-CoA carboxylase alpha chain